MKALACAALLACAPGVVLAEEEKPWYDYDHLYVQGGSYIHWSHSEDHAGSNIFTAIEAVREDGWLGGLALFDNSFGQFSQYLYGGTSWDFHDNFEGFHAKLTFGLIHGYKDEFEDKIPLNKYGVAPAIIPGVGYKKDRWGADMFLLGGAGLLFTIGYEI